MRSIIACISITDIIGRLLFAQTILAEAGLTRYRFFVIGAAPKGLPHLPAQGAKVGG